MQLKLSPPYKLVDSQRWLADSQENIAAKMAKL